MIATLKLGWRNIWRNRRRTLISMAAVGLGLMLVLVYGGLIAGMMEDAKNQLDNSGMGHVEVSASGWRTHRNARRFLAEPGSLAGRLALPEGAEVGFRVVARGLLTSARASEGVELHGVDWADERHLAAYVSDIRQGELPAADDLRGILIGERLAERLKVDVGKKLRLMVQRADGEMGAELFRVRGIYHSIAPSISQRRVLVSRQAAQGLLGTGDGAHQVIIQLARAAEAEEVAARLRVALGPDVEVFSYGDLMPLLKTMERLTDNIVLVAALFVYLLVGLGILNTMWMSVLERTREFGVMQALGTRPGGILAIVLAESFWIATLSAAIGLAAGLAITWYGSRAGLLDFSKALGESMELGGAVLRSAFKTRFSPHDALRATVVVYLMALLVGIFPALRVSRMRPVNALRAH